MYIDSELLSLRMVVHGREGRGGVEAGSRGGENRWKTNPRVK